METGTPNYAELLTELTRASRERARARARGLLAAAGLEDAAADAGERASRLADEVLQASRANRRLVHTLIGEEMARAADRWGFVRAEELADLRREIDELRVALIKATGGPAPTRPTTRIRPHPARRTARVRRSSSRSRGPSSVG